ncbi:hypothetical protein MRB53_037789 [Persea americana]|nr:hypothetical protein MRB53_037789 [Persea americana]
MRHRAWRLCRVCPSLSLGGRNGTSMSLYHDGRCTRTDAAMLKGARSGESELLQAMTSSDKSNHWPIAESGHVTTYWIATTTTLVFNGVSQSQRRRSRHVHALPYPVRRDHDTAERCRSLNSSRGLSRAIRHEAACAFLPSQPRRYTTTRTFVDNLVF